MFAPTAIENTSGLPALSDVLCYAGTDEHHEIVASAAGTLLNCAAQKGMSNTIMAEEPDILSRLFACVKVTEAVPQVANAIGAVHLHIHLASDATPWG